jgi:hypothetical protein
VSILISADDPRSIKALEIAAGASSWLKLRSLHTGEVGYGVPSQCPTKPGLYYLVTTSSCTCEDFKRTGLSSPRIGQVGEHGLCKHARAVLLHLELVKAQQMPKRARKPRLVVVQPVADTWHPPITCDECGCFPSKHDEACSLWTEPLAPMTDEQHRRIFGTVSRTERED